MFNDALLDFNGDRLMLPVTLLTTVTLNYRLNPSKCFENTLSRASIWIEDRVDRKHFISFVSASCLCFCVLPAVCVRTSAVCVFCVWASGLDFRFARTCIAYRVRFPISFVCGGGGKGGFQIFKIKNTRYFCHFRLICSPAVNFLPYLLFAVCRQLTAAALKWTPCLETLPTLTQIIAMSQMSCIAMIVTSD